MSSVLERPTAAPQLSPDPARRPARGRRLAVGAAVLAVVGAGAAYLQRGDDPIDQRGYAPAFELDGVTDGAPAELSANDTPTRPAPTAADAVSRFLDAEIDGDAAGSYALLDPASRKKIGGLSAWEDTADERIPYVGYRITSSRGDRVEVEVDATPVVSEINGVIASRSSVSFAVTADAKGSLVSLSGTTVTPQYPSDATTGETAVEWVTAAQSCAPGATNRVSYAGTAIGTSGLAETLCRAAGSPIAGTTGRLERLADPAGVLAQFGSDATEWARVVTITGVTAAGVKPTGIDIVLAPLGDRWVVVGTYAR